MPGEFTKMVITTIIGMIVLSLLIFNTSRTLEKSSLIYSILSEQEKAKEVLKYIIHNCLNGTLFVDNEVVDYFRKNPYDLLECAPSDFLYSLQIETLPMNYTDNPDGKTIVVVTDLEYVKDPHYIHTMREGLSMFIKECTNKKDNLIIGSESNINIDRVRSEFYFADYIIILAFEVSKDSQVLCNKHMNMMYRGKKIVGTKGTNVLTVVAEQNPLCTNIPRIKEDGAAVMLESGKYGEVVIAKSPNAVRGAMCMFVKSGPPSIYAAESFFINTTSHIPDSSVSVPIILKRDDSFLPAHAILYIYHSPEIDFMKKAELVCKSGKDQIFRGRIGMINADKGKICSSDACIPFPCDLEIRRNKGTIVLRKDGNKVVAE